MGIQPLKTPSWSIPASSKPSSFWKRTRIVPFRRRGERLASWAYPSSTILPRRTVMSEDGGEEREDVEAAEDPDNVWDTISSRVLNVQLLFSDEAHFRKKITLASSLMTCGISCKIFYEMKKKPQLPSLPCTWSWIIRARNFLLTLEPFRPFSISLTRIFIFPDSMSQSPSAQNFRLESRR